jgi:hypothetical protein
MEVEGLEKRKHNSGSSQRGFVFPPKEYPKEDIEKGGFPPRESTITTITATSSAAHKSWRNTTDSGHKSWMQEITPKHIFGGSIV